MKYYYNVLIDLNMGLDTLVYSCDQLVKPYLLVKIEIGKKECLGIILSLVNNIKELSFDLDKINNILSISTYYFNKDYITFNKLISNNTFISLPAVVGQTLLSFEGLGKRGLGELFSAQSGSVASGSDSLLSSTSEINQNIIQKDFNRPEPVLIKPQINYHLDINIIRRIRYIIRTILNINFISNTSESKPFSLNKNPTKNKTILIFCPEIKVLTNVKYAMQEEFKDIKSGLNIWEYSNGANKESKRLVKYLIQTTQENQIKYRILAEVNFKCNNANSHTKNSNKEQINTKFIDIIICTKSALFLPFVNIDDIIVIDEASSFYLQDQNSLYYDLRELVFLFSTSYNSNLTFLSSVPSMRLYDYSINNPNEDLDQDLIYMSKQLKKALKIQLHEAKKSNLEMDGLFSFPLGQLLYDLDD